MWNLNRATDHQGLCKADPAITKARAGLGTEGRLELMPSEILSSDTLEVKGNRDPNTQSTFPNMPALSLAFLKFHFQ